MPDFIIQVVCARNLPDWHLFSNAAPYVEVRCGREMRRTNADRNGRENPQWNEEVRIPYSDYMSGESIVFRVKDHNYIESDQFIAQFSIPVYDLEQQRESRNAYELLNSRMEPSNGRLELVIVNEHYGYGGGGGMGGGMGGGFQQGYGNQGGGGFQQQGGYDQFGNQQGGYGGGGGGGGFQQQDGYDQFGNPIQQQGFNQGGGGGGFQGGGGGGGHHHHHRREEEY